jgi:hypothetical protein
MDDYQWESEWFGYIWGTPLMIIQIDQWILGCSMFSEKLTSSEEFEVTAGAHVHMRISEPTYHIQI